MKPLHLLNSDRNYLRKLKDCVHCTPKYDIKVNEQAHVVLPEVLPKDQIKNPAVYLLYLGNTLLYVGVTYRSLYTRVYRYFKELLGISHRQETHPAAKKHRQWLISQCIDIEEYVTRNIFSLKVVHVDELETVLNDLDISQKDLSSKYSVDEYIASLMGAKYNTRKPQIVGVGPTLERFF